MLTENLNNAKGFEHLFSITRRVGKVDDLVTVLDFQLPQIKQILENSTLSGKEKPGKSD